MIVRKQSKNYLKRAKYIRGSGIQDIFSYIGENKDLLAKPLIAATGQLAAGALTEIGRAALNRILQRKKGEGIKRF
jgi:hypothetical protein